MAFLLSVVAIIGETRKFRRKITSFFDFAEGRLPDFLIIVVQQEKTEPTRLCGNRHVIERFRTSLCLSRGVCVLKSNDGRRRGGTFDKRLVLGKLLATPGALEAITTSGQTPAVFLARHQVGDWGVVGDEDRHLNDQACLDG